MTFTRKKPSTWEELLSLKHYISSTDEICRYPDDHEFYITYSRLVPRAIFLQIIKEQMKGKEIALLKNNFPYGLLLEDVPFVKHYLVWSTKGKITPEDIIELIEEVFPGKKWFETESHDEKKSVPEIWHTQVFINNG